MEGTDEENFLSLMRSFGIEPRPFDGKLHRWIISAGDNSKVIGYYGFCALWSFDGGEKFQTVELAE